ncbi:MAG TPA: hypothetical protein VMB05_05480 [Solirubrobacteraceae bacterium]|nr:hypothetical protein [Solirubrobacteraceae bacterium]
MSRSKAKRPRLLGMLLGAIAALLVFVVVFIVALIATAAPASAINVEIVNSSGRPASGIYLTLEHGSSSDGQLPEEVPTPLSQIKDSTFALGEISAGRLYVSYGGPVTTKEPPYATTRYDKIELTNPGVADLTAVDFFAIPFNMQSLDASGATVGDAVGYRCFTSTLLQRLRPLGPGAEVTSGGQFVRFLSPQLANPETFTSLAPYVESMAGQTIEVNDTFAKEKEPAKAIHYTGTFESGGSITLTGTVAGVAGQPVHIEGATLPNAVYTGNGAFTVGGEPADVSQNNEYSVIYRDIVAGFGLGYWGGRYGNNTAAWLHKPDFAAARLGPEPFPTYSLYASTLAEYSTAYGFSFSELGPDEITTPLESGVATLQLTIDPDQGPNTPGCVGQSTPAAPSAPGSSANPVAHPGIGPTPPGQVSVTIDPGSVRLDKRGRARLTLSCGGDPCKGELTLSPSILATRRRRGHGHARMHGHARAHHARFVRKVLATKRTTLLGRVAFSIEEGRRQSVLVPISVAGRRAIQSSKGERLDVLAQADVGPVGQPTIAGQRALVLRGYIQPRRRAKR